MYHNKFPENPLTHIKRREGAASSDSPTSPVLPKCKTGVRTHFRQEYDSIGVTMHGRTMSGAQAITLWEMERNARHIRDLKNLGMSEMEIVDLLKSTPIPCAT